MQPADGGVPALLLEPGHGAVVGPHPVPVGYVPGEKGKEGAAVRGEAEDHPPVGSQDPGPAPALGQGLPPSPGAHKGPF